MNAAVPTFQRENPAPLLNADQALSQVTAQWDSDIVKQLTDYIAIPAKSPTFDPDWAKHGFIDTAARHAAEWVEAQKVEGLTLEIVRLEGRTPVIFFEIPATRAGSTQTVLMYGHLDKQPEFSGWRNDLGAVDAKVRRWPALRPGRRRRRLRGLCQHCRRAGVKSAKRAASAHRRLD